MSNMNYFEVDEFGDINEIPAIYPRNPYDDQDADNIFGLGNKQKKAEKKLAKAEKKLAKGKTAKAEKKIAKAEKLLGKVEQGVAKNQPLIDQLKARSGAITNATSTQQTENISTDAGQIGSAAQPPTDYSLPASAIGGGGGGDISDMGYSPETTTTGTIPNENDEPTGDMATTKDLQGVTVTSNKGLPVWIILIGVAVVIVAIWYFSKKKK